MCLALYKPAGIEVNWAALETGMLYNSDGAGFAVAVDGQLIIEKGFFKWEDFKKAFEPFAEHSAIVHFRLATHGAKNQANCHPFALADFGGDNMPVAVIHNGIFSDASSDQKQWSDTWHVCRDVLHPLWKRDAKIFGEDAMVTLGDRFVGSSNKLVFLAADGTATLWGESNGHWSDGIWYSNHSYECSSYADPRYRGSRRYAGYHSYMDDDDYWTASGSKSAKASAAVMDGKKLDEFAYGKLPADEEEDNDDPILDLDRCGGPKEQSAFKELRDCGYTEVELEEIFLDDGIEGLIEELATMYSMDTNSVSMWLDSQALHSPKDDDVEEYSVALNNATGMYEPV
jgi:hypothetical protein